MKNLDCDWFSDLGLRDNHLSGFLKWRRVVFAEVTDEEICNIDENTAPKSILKEVKKIGLNYFELKNYVVKS